MPSLRSGQAPCSTPHRIRQPPPTRTYATTGHVLPCDSPDSREMSRWHQLVAKAASTWLASRPTQVSNDGRRRVDELQFVRCEGGDQLLLIGSDQVRKRTPLNLSGDDLIPLVDRVCAEVSDRSLHHGLVFLRSPLIAPVGRELGEVGACVHQRKVTVSLFCA